MSVPTPPASPRSPVDRPEFRLGVRLHNDGEFYEAHEAWERVWRDEEDEDERLFVQGLIQITAGCHKIVEQRLPNAGRRLLERGLQKLDPFEAIHHGVELGAFRTAVRRWMETLAHEGAIERATVPRLVLEAER